MFERVMFYRSSQNWDIFMMGLCSIAPVLGCLAILTIVIKLTAH